MKMILALMLVIVLGFIILPNIYAQEIQKDDILFARSGLRGEGGKILFHNMSSLAVLIPLGTEVKVNKLGRGMIEVERVDNGQKYRVYEISNLWSKFFVRNKEELGLSRMPKKIKEAIENNHILDGMTKEEVYLSKGCPAYIGYGIKSNSYSLEDVLKSDVWYYNLNSRLKDAVVTFENGKVVGFVDRELKAKMKVEAAKEDKK